MLKLNNKRVESERKKEGMRRRERAAKRKHY